MHNKWICIALCNMTIHLNIEHFLLNTIERKRIRNLENFITQNMIL